MRSGPRRKLGVYSLGFFKRTGLRAALELAGWDVVPGPLFKDIDAVGIWGGRPVASRGIKAAKRRGLPILHLEDAPLRSVTPGASEPIMGLTLDTLGSYLDCSQPSDLERILNEKVKKERPTTSAALEAYLNSGLSKYNDHYRPASDLPEGPFVLVIDQLRGDASIRLGGADAAHFAAMLAAAKSENPDVPIYIRRHPRAIDAPMRGHFSDLPEGVQFLKDGFAICDVLDRAASVYCVTSQVGFEAILKGHKPRIFGAPFYAGWGLSEDETELPRRRLGLSVEALFQGVMLDYPIWFDVYSGKLSEFMPALNGLEARRRAHQIRSGGAVALGMRLWKRPFVRDLLGDTRFCDDPRKAQELASKEKRQLVGWASSEVAQKLDAPYVRMEDGFLRSVGLGADLVEPLSLCLDDLGIYYDPTGPSRLEKLIADSRDLSNGQLVRAADLRGQLVDGGLSKYNLGSDRVEVPKTAHVILVPGQVEDDASIRLGASDVSTNQGLLEAVRRDNPQGYILYKPHPDVEAGLRAGALAKAEGLYDQILRGVSAEAALEVANEVSTITSLIGFEALLRGKKTVCYGRPFYAGWGLTQDRGGKIERRKTGISLDGLVHAALIDYPVYRDPISGLACPVEIVVERLLAGAQGRRPKVLSKLQGLLASQSWLWR